MTFILLLQFFEAESDAVGCIPGLIGLAGIMTISEQRRYNLVACAWVQSALGSPVVLNWQVSRHNRKVWLQVHSG